MLKTAKNIVEFENICPSISICLNKNVDITKICTAPNSVSLNSVHVKFAGNHI